MGSQNTPNESQLLSAEALASLTEVPFNVEGLSGGQEAVWLEVIGKMEEVYTGLLQDEAELEEKNAALEDAKRFIDSVLSAMSDLMVVCDRKGNILQLNRAFSELAGETEEELLGKSLRDMVITPDDEAEFSLRSCHDTEARLKTARGLSDLFSLTCTMRKDRRGRQGGYVITGRPIGELRRAYAALERAHDDLKQSQQRMIYAEKMASVGRLVAGVAHELNNPISFVYSNMHPLKDYAARLQQYLSIVHNMPGNEELSAVRKSLGIDDILDDLPPLVEAVEEGAERARDIVKGLRRMSFSGPENSKQIDMSGIVTSALTWARRGRKADVNISLALGNNLFIMGQESQVQQVALNLIQNAFDAMQGMPDRRLDIQTYRENGQIIAKFRDHGPGIPEDLLAKIFEPFFTTKDIGEGTGLGLWVSFDIVKAHGGDLTADNHPDGGAVLTMSLPEMAAPEQIHDGEEDT
jgi:two-component system sensor histidine kinase HupT/HoxJ